MHDGSVCLSLSHSVTGDAPMHLGGKKKKRKNPFLVDEAGSGSRLISNPDAAGKISLQKCFIYSGLNNN